MLKLLVCCICGCRFNYPASLPRSSCLKCSPLPPSYDVPAIVAAYESGLSVAATAKVFGSSSEIISAVVWQFGALRVRFQDAPLHLDLSFFDGFMAGDGCLTRRGVSGNAHVSFGSSKSDYVDYVRECLISQGVSMGRRYQNTVCRSGSVVFKNPVVTYASSSHNHKEFSAQHSRWYTNGGHKALPLDAHFSPRMFLEWYLGDGTNLLSGSKSGSRFIRIVNCDFPVSDLHRAADYLVSVFGSDFLRVYEAPSGRVRYIRISPSAVSDFLSWVGPCPVPSYLYKWRGI